MIRVDSDKIVFILVVIKVGNRMLGIKFLWTFVALLGSLAAQDQGPTCQDNFLCSKDFCTPGVCPIAPGCSRDEEEECEGGELMRIFGDSDDYCDCCPKRCLGHLKEGDQCDVTFSGNVPDSLCGPGLGNV